MGWVVDGVDDESCCVKNRYPSSSNNHSLSTRSLLEYFYAQVETQVLLLQREQIYWGRINIHIILYAQDISECVSSAAGWPPFSNDTMILSSQSPHIHRNAPPDHDVIYIFLSIRRIQKR